MDNTVVFTAHSAMAYFWLLCFYTALPVAILCGLFSIIKKSGFSQGWIVLPAIPTLCTMLLAYLLFFIPVTLAVGLARISAPSTIATWRVLADLIAAFDLLNLLAFFVFAFVQWPIEREVANLRASLREARGAALLQYASAQARPSSSTVTATRVPPSGGGRPGFGPATAVLVAPAPPVAAEATRFYCSWCGKARSPDDDVIHHCGARTRPPVFCASCGRGFEGRAQFCDRCGTAASTLSPP
ncbi:MAG TPA: zinc ribbon domain-containing protein [Acidimicrobiales bacterium]|jgi:hypothetical protein|nr:zinc ribbon domain-containing protein [Acidimicrobiales bacterium]